MRTSDHGRQVSWDLDPRVGYVRALRRDGADIVYAASLALFFYGAGRKPTRKRYPRLAA